jgi:hypothetical protein
MLIWIHLVVLDNHFNQEFLLLIVRLSILSHSHSLWCLECKQKIALSIYLCLEPIFIFLFLLFQMISTWSSMSIITSMDHLLASPLEMYQPYLIHTLSIKVSTRFHQLSKTKLGLSISPFLVIDDNLFTKIFNKIFLDSCCLPKHITMCNDYGQVLST